MQVHEVRCELGVLWSEEKVKRRKAKGVGGVPLSLGGSAWAAGELRALLAEERKQA